MPITVSTVYLKSLIILELHLYGNNFILKENSIIAHLELLYPQNCGRDRAIYELQR